MTSLHHDINVKRVSSRKRSRDSLRNHLTPAKKGGGQWVHDQGDAEGKEQPIVRTECKLSEYCSDNEDLFGDYDSIVGDSSFLAKLEDVELDMVQHRSSCTHERDPALEKYPNVEQLAEYQEQDFTALRTADHLKQAHKEALSDYNSLSDLREESFEDLPSSQIAFQQDILKRAEVKQKGSNTSSPVVKNGRICVTPEGKREKQVADAVPKPRRSMTEQLKRAMLGNAATSSPSISRLAVQKEAVVTEEISVAVQAMESVYTETDLGPFFGLPSKVKDLISKLRGIKDLYEWQKTCLTLDSVQQRRNLIYSLPTSGGKTLVAEILILKELLCRKKDALFILPYISLVQEKVRGLASFGLELDFLVEEYAGSKGKFPPVKRRANNSLYIATIEKGHSLVNSLVETGRLDSIGLVVVDELHMLGDGNRGAILEMTLTKVLYVSRDTQIIGMSATLGNTGDLKTFLKADNYTNDFRPVQLKEYVKLRDSIYEVNPIEEECFRLSRPLNFKYSANMQKIDPDHIIALVTEVIPMHSCLVFCPTKKNCENVAVMICKYLKKEFLAHKEGEKAVLLEELRASGNGSLCPVLQRTVPYGLAYHHSGLTSDERKLVEEAYSSGVLCLLTCTSTLAAGINLPARRVILRSPYVATDFLKRSQYKQMVGRAGRAGIDTSGESILILQEKDKLMAKQLLSSPMERCYSNLMHDNGKGIQSLILSLIGLNITKSLVDIKEFMSFTLLSVQEAHICQEKSLWDITQESVQFLKQKGLISVSTDLGSSTVLTITKLGKATYKGSIDLTYSDTLYKDLLKGLESLVLNSFLHLIYLVTPYDMVSQCKPDWMVYYRQFSMLSASEQKMSAFVGVPESFVARKAAGQSVKKTVDTVVVNRLYLALVLFSLLKETDLWSVSDKFQLPRGFIQNLLSSSSAFSSCVLHFTEELEEFWAYKALLTELTRRLTYCVQPELIPLMEVAGVLEVRAKQLYKAGYKTLAHLANADPNLLVRSVQNLSKRQAKQIVASAKMLLTEKAEALQEEVDDLLTLPLDLPSS
ncbi:helicase POLQ-like [Megalops cyprinoides]|uniref:helicase POLQ-like n=1 Tax=Megalops cyprinoides TaxID=118141 RepID=UPI0018652EDB|nr:helicase POLQ-like [Megalops cyprinoides]